MSTVYQIITDRIIDKLENGVIPWKQPWKHYLSEHAPSNIVSKKPYRGINTFMLASSGFNSNFWGSYKQWSSLGGQVRKGEKGTPVIFWSSSKYVKEGSNGEKEEKTGLLLRYYTVFNASQVEGVELPKISLPSSEVQPIDRCVSMIENAKTMNRIPEIEHKESRAYYSASKDLVNMPLPGSFKDGEHYYSVLFHELIHSSGHKDRLNRDGITGSHSFGSKAYSQEELIAEMGSAFLCGHAEILPSTIEDSAAYLKSWIQALKGDSKLLIHAASKAQKAAEYLLGIEQQKIEDKED